MQADGGATELRDLSVETAFRRAPGYVGRSWTHDADRWIDVVDPSDGETIGSVPQMDAGDVDRAGAAAAEYGREWASVPASERAAVLLRAAAILEKHAAAVADTLRREGGRPRLEAGGEVAKSVQTFRYYAGLVGALDGRAFDGGAPRMRHETRREPVGVVTAITPWNVPAASPARKLAPALLAGNAVLLKPATATPLSAYFLVRCLYEAGLPDGVVQLVTGSGSVVGAAAATHPDVGAVSFTGSTDVGIALQRELAGRLTKVQLELGGKNAAIVLPDADLERAASSIMAAAFAAAGQQCTATSRVIVHREVAAPLVSILRSRIEELRVGPTADDRTEMGPLIDAGQVESVHGFVGRAVAAGAKVEAGGEPVRGTGYFYAPTLMTGVQPSSELAREEVFGPVLAVLEVADLDEAVAVADRTPYGLSCAVHTSDVAAAQRIAAAVDCGVISVNGPTAGIELTAPFGGFKASGTPSKEHGPEALDFFTRTKLVTWRW